MAKNANFFDEALAAEGVTGNLASLARSIYQQESGSGSNTKTSNAGAVGGMQVVPKTFERMADKGWDINNPMDNARAGIRYLKLLDKRSGGVPELTAAGYYGGEGAIDKAKKGIAVSDPRNPKAPNTLEYGKQVAARLGKEGVVTPMVSEDVAAPMTASPGPVIPLASPPMRYKPAGDWAALAQAMPSPDPAAALSAYTPARLGGLAALGGSSADAALIPLLGLRG